MKRCPKCKEKYPATVEYFYSNKSKPLGLTTYCKDCTKTIFSVWSSESEERSLSLKYIQRVRLLKKVYNLTEEDVRNLMDLFRGACHICGDSLVVPDSNKSYHIDHNHETGEIRGLLCHLCNVGLGHFKDSPDLLDRAAKYLRDRQ